MTYINGSKERFRAFMALPDNGKIKMLNLLKFKDQVAPLGKTGRELYRDYLTATQPFFEKANARIIFYGTPQFTLIGPDQLEWDKVLIVEYDSKADFMQMVTAEGYPSTMRSEALEDSRLIFCS